MATSTSWPLSKGRPGVNGDWGTMAFEIWGVAAPAFPLKARAPSPAMATAAVEVTTVFVTRRTDMGNSLSKKGRIRMFVLGEFAPEVGRQ
jgi:hypothetical protein